MAIYKRGGVWWVDVYVGSGTRRRRVRKSTGCTEEVQAKMVEQTMIAVNRGITNRQRAQSILDNILPEEERGVAIGDCRAFYEECVNREGIVLSKIEFQHRLNAISRFSEWAVDNTRVKWAHEVNAETAWAYSCHIGKRNVTAKTRNNELGQLRSAWKMLEKYGKVDNNPWGLARAARDRSEEKHGRAFSNEEIQRILLAAREIGCEWEDMVIVALYTGLRKGDIENMKWEGDPKTCVIADLENRRIYGTPSKTARKRVKVDIPMHDKVFDALAQKERKGEYVFWWRKNHEAAHKTTKDDIPFSKVLELANIAAGDDEKVSFHSLRHTFVTRLADAGVAEDVRMRLAGHTNAATHGLYTHEDVQSKAAIKSLK